MPVSGALTGPRPDLVLAMVDAIALASALGPAGPRNLVPSAPVVMLVVYAIVLIR